jgi:GcrA cell cycle regulator
MNYAWTEERIEQAKTLWIEGKSAAQIAAMMPGNLTRNAVIGKINRMGLQRRAPARLYKQTNTRITRPALRAPVKPKPVKVAKPPKATTQAPTPINVLSPNARPWMERKAGECAWPIGERYALLSCCNPVSERGWCAGHFAVGTVEKQPRPLRASSAPFFTRHDRTQPVAIPTQPEPTAWDQGRAA